MILFARRSALLSFFAIPLIAYAAACSKAQGRCGYCGMKLDPASAWTCDLTTTAGGVVRFDTPRCALLAWRTGKVAARGVRVQDFYDRQWRDGGDVVFAIGSDVLGPMGPELVPVDRTRAAKFTSDHHASTLALLDELDLAHLRAP